jgi:HlyD family secretion protein
VSATGTLNAVVTVLVGSQISGQIKELRADFNSVVKKDQVIARIDPETFEAKVRQARAELDAARAAVLNQQAQVERARADVENARAALAEGRAQTARAQATSLDARRDLERKRELFERQLIAKSERDTAQATSDSAGASVDAARAKERSLQAAIGAAEAQLKVAQAALASAAATVKQRAAALQQAQVDLDRTVIRAPVDGVVISRAVDVGQTVAASLQAPTLFTIAQDLTQMQVDTSVDEADIGRIRLDGPATFTVDAFPGRTFQGRITQIRKAAQVVQNVVTYTVVVSVGNPDGRLVPGMTANVKLVVAEKSDVLKIPNAALRFRPPGVEGSDAQAPAPSPARPGGGAGPGGRPGGQPSAEEIRERLTGALALSAEQQAILDQILQDARQQMVALRGGHVPPEQRQQRAQRIREASRQKIREILTPAQREKYDQLQGEGGGAQGRVWVLGEDGKPRAVALRLGLSDGSATEVVAGDLKPGQDVIIGAAAAGRTGPGGAPRLRL